MLRKLPDLIESLFGVLIGFLTARAPLSRTAPDATRSAACTSSTPRGGAGAVGGAPHS